MSLIDHILQPQILMGLLVLTGIGVIIHLIINANNPLHWWHFISSKSKDGKHYADIDKLGKAVGIVVGSYVVMASKGDSTTLFIYLAYVGAVGSWSTYLRNKDSGQLPAPPKV